eukprot:3456169-Rhodomonas_salina.10
MSATDIRQTAYARPMRCLVLTQGIPLSAYARVTRCPVLKSAMLLPGELEPQPRDPASAAYGAICLRARYAMSGTGNSIWHSLPARGRESFFAEGTGGGGYAVEVKSAIRLRACYALSGTDLSYAAISLCKCVETPGTDLAHGGAVSRQASYTLSGTDLAYAATSWKS